MSALHLAAGYHWTWVKKVKALIHKSGPKITQVPCCFPPEGRHFVALTTMEKIFEIGRTYCKKGKYKVML